MSRRCLQGILSEKGYKQKNLVKQIDGLLAETEPKRTLPTALHMSVDAIRQYGNFGAHPIDDLTTLQIIDVEPGEAEWCIEITEQLMSWSTTSSGQRWSNGGLQPQMPSSNQGGSRRSRADRQLSRLPGHRVNTPRRNV
jgi:hypothetical protein